MVTAATQKGFIPLFMRPSLSMTSANEGGSQERQLPSPCMPTLDHIGQQTCPDVPYEPMADNRAQTSARQLPNRRWSDAKSITAGQMRRAQAPAAYIKSAADRRVYGRQVGSGQPDGGIGDGGGCQIDDPCGRVAVDAGGVSRSSWASRPDEIGSMAVALGTPKRHWPRPPQTSLVPRSHLRRDAVVRARHTPQPTPTMTSLSLFSAGFFTFCRIKTK
jgi:hypothetical protein